MSVEPKQELDPAISECICEGNSKCTTAARMRSLGKGTGLVIAILIACGALFRVLAFVRELLIAHQFGTAIQADAYFASFYLPGYFFMILGNNGLANAIVPYLIQGQKSSIAERMGTALTTFVTCGLALSTALFLLAPALTRWLFPGMSGPAIHLTIGLSRCMAPAVLFIMMSIVLSAIFQSVEHFILPASSGLLMVSTMVVSVWLAPHLMGIYTVGFGFVAGSLLQLIVLLLGVQHSEALGWSSKWNAGVDLTLLRYCVPAFGASFFFLAVDVLLRSFGSNLPEGGISALMYASKIVVLPGIVLAIPVSTAYLPKLAKLFQERDEQAFQQLSLRIIGLLTVALFPLAILSHLLREPLVNILFHHGAFTDQSVSSTTDALGAFSPAIIFGPLTVLLQTICYARQNRRQPLTVGIPLLATMLIAGHVLTNRYAIMGVAGSYSLAWLSAALYLLIYLARGADQRIKRASVVFFSKVCLSSSISALIATRTATPIPGDVWGRIYSILMRTGVLCSSYLIMLVFTGVIQADHCRQFVNLLASSAKRKSDVDTGIIISQE